MGIIRNRVTLVHHYNLDEITKLREDAIKTFETGLDDLQYPIVGSIMTSYFNEEYTFMINGDCSKNVWKRNEEFIAIRKEWCEKHKNDGAVIVVVNLGEDYPASIDFDNMKEKDEV
jgi:hypothetical protein